MPRTHQANRYTDLGYESRDDYLATLADDMGCDTNIVYALSEVLGEGEDFDGLVTELEDMTNMLEGY